MPSFELLLLCSLRERLINDSLMPNIEKERKKDQESNEGKKRSKQ